MNECDWNTNITYTNTHIDEFNRFNDDREPIFEYFTNYVPTIPDQNILSQIINN